jgi:hypothetical protein
VLDEASVVPPVVPVGSVEEQIALLCSARDTEREKIRACTEKLREFTEKVSQLNRTVLNASVAIDVFTAEINRLREFN